jgi:UDP-2,3-diacylglucosamine pyrophosphatase LpxH
MNKITLDGNKQLILLGDIHGDWNELLYRIDRKNIENSIIFSVGDLGIGFKETKEQEYALAEKLNKEFNAKNINFYSIRGNHDNLYFFKGEQRICLENFELIEDYTVLEYNDKKIQAIGGAISIDRTGRTEGVSYWKDETVEYKKELLQKVDILITHTAPSWCFPKSFNEMVYGWANEDSFLLNELTHERYMLDEIFKKCLPKHHYYGHFHSSQMENINGCIHRLLNIDELLEFRQ